MAIVDVSGKPAVIEFGSLLDSPCEQVWSRVETIDGVNAELWPIAMRSPPEYSSLERLAPGGEPIGILVSLFGIVPLDWHRLGLAQVTPGRGFHEVSSSLWMRHWRHERQLEPCSSKCLLSDRVEFIPRLAWLAPCLTPIYRAIFARRHRRLRAYFGGAPAPK
jgi:ligand-binding SRPBCC domain-containing protein